MDWDTDGDKIVQSSGSKLLSNDYQGEEAAMVQAYVDSKGGEANIDSTAAYFFAVYEASKIEDNLLGKMPSEEQFGFLYTASLSNTNGMARTIAHELVHGAYHLEHIFNPIYLGLGPSDLNKTSSLNLMSYYNSTDANELWKFQWDVVNAPGHVWVVLKRDKDAEAVSRKRKRIQKAT